MTMTLNDFFTQHPKVALGFSGGVDSSYLLYAGIQCGADIQAYYVDAAFQPRFELEHARRLAKDVGAQMTVIPADILSHKTVAANPADRCYHCKQVIFGTLKERAAADGYPILIDGSNASDDASDRPGMRALKELEVRSPLRECGLTKAQIRALSKEAGLFTWDKPAYACLATRVPTGRELTAPLLQRIEAAEDALFALDFSDFRVRVYGEAARIQLPADQMAQALERREALLEALSPHFNPVLLDLESR